MTTLPTDRRHERALVRLTDALKKPGIEALLKSYLSALDDVEEELAGLAVGMTSIDEAEGVQLRNLARIVGSQEVGDDVLQRILIRTHVSVVRSSGTGDDLLRILRLITDTAELVEYFPASVVVGTFYETPESHALYVYNFMVRARSAGIYLQLLWTTGTQALAFRFASAPEDDVVDIIETACAMTASIVIGPDGTELISAALTLSAVGDAEVVIEEDRLDLVTADTFPREALASGAGLNGWVSSSATAGNFSSGASVMVAVAFYVESWTPGAERLIASKRDDAGGNAGWEIFLSSTGRLSARFDSAAGAPTSISLASSRASQPGWHVAVLGLDVSLGDVLVLTDEEGEDNFGFYSDDPSNTDPLAFGTARGVPGPGLLVKFFAEFQGAQTEGLVPALLAGPALGDALGYDAQTDAATGFAPDDQSVGGQLINVF